MITKDDVCLTHHELYKLKDNEWINGRWYYNPYEIAQAQLKKVLELIQRKSWSSGTSFLNPTRIVWEEDWQAIKEIAGVK